MFNRHIVENLMGSVINSRKESTFRYLSPSMKLDTFAENFLNADDERLTVVNCNDVFNFLVCEFKKLGFYYSTEGIFINESLFKSGQSINDHILDRVNPDLGLLVLGADNSNLKVLDLIGNLARVESLSESIIYNTINDIGFILATMNDANKKAAYEGHLLNILSFSNSAETFKNVLSSNYKISGVFELISNLPQKNNIMFELANDTSTIVNIPNQILMEFILEVPSHDFNDLDNDAFLKLLEIIPISSIINYGNAAQSNQETIFSKYTFKIKSMINNSNISSKLIDILKEQADTNSTEGQLLLQLLSEAISRFLVGKTVSTQTIDDTPKFVGNAAQTVNVAPTFVENTAHTINTIPVGNTDNTINTMPIENVQTIMEPQPITAMSQEEEELNVYESTQIQNQAVVNPVTHNVPFSGSVELNANEEDFEEDVNESDFNTTSNSPIENNRGFSMPHMNVNNQNQFVNTTDCENKQAGPFHTFC